MNGRENTHLSLFSGIGGIDLAAEWAGFETVCFVEIDKFCQTILKRHWPAVPIIEDVHDVTKEKVMAYAEVGQPRKSEDWNGREGIGGGGEERGVPSVVSHSPITLITGGFPCQPVSVAGKRRGKKDDRWLWPEMLRVISEVRPTWVVAENVAGLARMGLNDCLADLEGEGFEVTTFLIPACAVNAPHRRDRIFIVAHSRCEYETQYEQPTAGLRESGEDVADANTERLQRHRGLRECGGQWLAWKGDQPLEGIWESEPNVGRVAHGVPSRVDRLRALGNAVVPQQIYPILKAIAEIERKRGR